MKTPANKAESMGEVKLTADQRLMMDVLNTPVGRAGWPLSIWPEVRRAFGPMIKAGLCKERRLGSRPGLEITPTGRALLKENGNG